MLLSAAGPPRLTAASGAACRQQRGQRSAAQPQLDAASDSVCKACNTPTRRLVGGSSPSSPCQLREPARPNKQLGGDESGIRQRIAGVPAVRQGAAAARVGARSCAGRDCQPTGSAGSRAAACLDAALPAGHLAHMCSTEVALSPGLAWPGLAWACCASPPLRLLAPVAAFRRSLSATPPP